MMVVLADAHVTFQAVMRTILPVDLALRAIAIDAVGTAITVMSLSPNI